MAQPRKWQNRDFYQPSAYSQFRLTDNSDVPVDVNTLLIIGTSEGGVPYDAPSEYDRPEDRSMVFTRSTDAERVLRSGDLLEAVKIAFAPSNDPDIAPASRVICIRSQQASPAALTLQNEASSNLYDLKTAEYGKFTNSIAIEVSEVDHPSLAGFKGRKITVFRDGGSIESPDLYRPVMKVNYTGSGAAASFSFDGSTYTVTVDGSTYTTTVEEMPTIGEVADFFEAQDSDIEIEVISPSFESEEVDTYSTVDIKAAEVIVAANYYEQIRWLTEVSEMFTGEIASGSPAKGNIKVMPKTYMAGGSTSNPTNSDWIGSIALSKKIEAFYQVELSGSLEIAILQKNAIIEMNDPKTKRERLGASGAGSDDTDSEIRSNAVKLNNAYYAYAGSPFYHVNSKGKTVVLPPRFSAVYSMAIMAGNGPTTAATKKPLSNQGNPKTYEPPEIDDFIRAGVQVIAPDSLTNSPQIVRSVTTYQGNNLIGSEQSMMATAIAVAKDFRIQMESSFIGENGSREAPALVDSRARTLLQGYLDLGYLTETNDQAAFENINVVFEGDSFFIESDGTLTAPINFIFSLFNFRPIGG